MDRHQPRRAIDILIAGPLPSIDMNVIAQAIADREAGRLQAEITALTDAEQLLGTSAPPTRSRRSSRTATTTATAEATKSDPKPARERRTMSAAEKKAVSARMTAYWAERRRKAGQEVALKDLPTAGRWDSPGYGLTG